MTITAAARPFIDPDQPDQWRHHAACHNLDIDPDLHFPPGGERGKPRIGASAAQAEQAKQFCRDLCPVIEQCLADALANNTEYGIFGGLDEDERRRLQRHAARPNLAELNAARGEAEECRNGHRQTPDAVTWDNRGYRVCKPCRRDNDLRHKDKAVARKKAARARRRAAARAAREQVTA